MKISKTIECTVVAALIIAASACTVNEPSPTIQEQHWLERKKAVCNALADSNVDTAEKVLIDGLKEAKSTHEYFQAVHCYVWLGRIYRYSGQSEKAAKNYDQLSTFAESVYGRQFAALPGYVAATADCYVDMKQYAKAESLYLRAIDLAKGQHTYHLPWLRKLARCYEHLKQSDKADKCYSEALSQTEGTLEPIEERSPSLLFDQANVYWDLSSFIAREKQDHKACDKMEEKASAFVARLIRMAGKEPDDDKRKDDTAKGQKQYILGFESKTDAAKLASLVDVLSDQGKFIDAEHLLDGLFDINVDLSGFANDDPDYHKQFITEFHHVWCAKGASN